MTEKEKVIAEIQQYLRNISKVSGDEVTIIPDGIYSSETAELVKSFQEKAGLEAKGIVNYETFTALEKENRRVVAENEEPLQVAPVKNSDFPLAYPLVSNNVTVLKNMLNHLADRYDNFERLEENNIFDRKTEEAVKRWQSVIFTEENGIVDKFTWNTLGEIYLLSSQ